MKKIGLAVVVLIGLFIVGGVITESYNSLIEWQDQVNSRLVYARSLSSNSVSIYAEGLNARTLVFVLPEKDPRACPRYIESVLDDPTTPEVPGQIKGAGYTAVVCGDTRRELK